MVEITKVYLLEDEMPESCYDCPFKDDFSDFPNFFCNVTCELLNDGEDISIKRHSTCPIVPYKK